jgi:hypothetical protein
MAPKDDPVICIPIPRSMKPPERVSVREAVQTGGGSLLPETG